MQAWLEKISSFSNHIVNHIYSYTVAAAFCVKINYNIIIDEISPFLGGVGKYQIWSHEKNGTPGQPSIINFWSYNFAVSYFTYIMGKVVS